MNLKMTFRQKLRLLEKDYPFEVVVCNKALNAEKSRIKSEIRDLRIELTGIPETGLFGEKLQEEHWNKIKKLTEKLKLL